MEGSEAVKQHSEKCLPVAVVVELVVGGHSDEPTPCTAQRVEDLRGSVSPHLDRQKTMCQYNH